MEGFDHTDNPLRPRGSKTVAETVAEAPEAWSGEGVAARNPGDIDATFAGFDPSAACLAGTSSLGDIDFGEFLNVPDPVEDEDDIEALAEAAIAGQTVLLDDNGNTVLEPPRRRSMLAPASPESEVIPQPQFSVYHVPFEELLLPPTAAPLAPAAESPPDDFDSLLKAYEPPTSTVEALPEQLEAEAIEVRWGGSASSGEPVAYFDVFVAVDDGPFEMWQEATSATSAAFTGEYGRRYAFFTVATDAAGNRQSLPDGAQAWVRLRAPAPVVAEPEPEPVPAVEEPAAAAEPQPVEAKALDPLPAKTQPLPEPVEPPVVVKVVPTRSAPVLDPARVLALPPLEMNTFTPEGAAVVELLGDAVVSCEPGLRCGVAVVARGGIPHGAWSYSLDGGKTWQPMPPVFHGGALLLGPDDRVRFVPRQMFTGTAGLTFRAWDQSTGVRGHLVALVRRGTTGGATAFSATVVTCPLPVVAQRTEPTPSYRTEATFPLVTGGQRGCMVARFPGAAAGGEPRGIAVVSLSGGADGRWQYSRDGGRTWKDFGSVYRGRARLLRAEDRVRFLPRGGYRGPARLIYHLWDQSGARQTANVLRAGAVGEGTPFSAVPQSTMWAL